MNFTSDKLRKMWLDFFASKSHHNVGSASLIPENDPSVLFTTAGMHPLVPFLLGEKHPYGTRLCNVQKCIRTNDIDVVGDNFHHTFFEMLGFWSLNDYFKEDTINWSFEFLTKYVGMDKDKFAVTCFAGNEFAPKDQKSIDVWKGLGIEEEKIFLFGMDENWWQIGRGPCGPCTEMFLDTGKAKCCEECSPACDCGKYIEVGNNVFMEYNRIEDEKYVPLGRHNVDVGLGMERTLAILNGTTDNYKTEFFAGIIAKIEELSGKKYLGDDSKQTKYFRIVADHIRTATAILGDRNFVLPSNTDAGYILRRIIRKAIKCARFLGIEKGQLGEIAKVYINQSASVYEEFLANQDRIVEELNKEEEKFLKTLLQGEKEFEKVVQGILRKADFFAKEGKECPKIISGKSAFRLYETFGYPLEITIEMAKEIGFSVDEKEFKECFEKHKELARTSSAGHFKGGLADDGVQTTRLHTAVHLLQSALKKVVSNDICQKGSNITSERLRFDFNFDKPLTKEQIQAVEEMVNAQIERKLDVTCEETSVADAKQKGALGVFESKYGDRVKVFSIGDFSCEICGGPHVQNTGEMGKFKIVKEQSSSSGVRRIKAVLQ